MTFTVDTSFRKDLKWPAGHGYGHNAGSDAHPIWVHGRDGSVTTGVIHSTNGRKGSTLAQEAKFLRDSPDVSAGDLIGKDGTIVELLPVEEEAWHAGVCIPAFANRHSFGIELHHAVGDDYPDSQIAALTWRVRQRIQQFGLKETDIDMHRIIARPLGRKVDPSDWDNADFYAWRRRLFAVAQTEIVSTTTYVVTSPIGLKIRTQPNTSTESLVVRVMKQGEYFPVSEVIQGEAVDGKTDWGHIADSSGFASLRWAEKAQ